MITGYVSDLDCFSDRSLSVLLLQSLYSELLICPSEFSCRSRCTLLLLPVLFNSFIFSKMLLCSLQKFSSSCWWKARITEIMDSVLGNVDSTLFRTMTLFLMLERGGCPTAGVLKLDDHFWMCRTYRGADGLGDAGLWEGEHIQQYLHDREGVRLTWGNAHVKNIVIRERVHCCVLSCWQTLP
jgi:hypothetical protein